MPIIGGGSIIPGDGGIAPTTDDTRSGGGGGGGGQGTSPIVFDVSPTFGQPYELEGTESEIEIRLENSNATIAAGVELSFDNTSLKMKDPPDFGTVDAPSYALSPGEVRFVHAVRGSSAPLFGGNSVSNTISYILSNGQTSQFSSDIVVHPTTLVSGYLSSLVPTSGMRFMIDHPSTGPITPSGTLTAAANFSLNPNGRTSVADTSVPGLTGYTENTYSNNGIVQVNFPNTTAGKAAITQNIVMPANHGRTYIWIYSQLVSGGHPNFGGQPLFGTIAEGGPAFYFSASPYSGRTYFVASRLNTGNTTAYMYYKGQALPTSSVITDVGHTVLGAGNPEHLNPGSAPTYSSPILTVLAFCYDNTTNDMTVRWKRTGHQSSGHSLLKMNNLYYTPQGNGGLTTSRHYYRPINVGYPIRHRLHSVFDKAMTESEFDTVCSIVGLSA